MTNYQITIGYKAIIQIDVKADTEKEAKEKALLIMKNKSDGMASRNVYIADANYGAHGIVNNSETWDMVQS